MNQSTAICFVFLVFLKDTDPEAVDDLNSRVVNAVAKFVDLGQSELTTLVADCQSKLADQGSSTVFLDAIQYLRDSNNQSQLEAYLDSLVEMALVDDRFEFGEGRLISSLAKAWDIHANQNESGSGNRLWSVLKTSDSYKAQYANEDWSVVHDLGLIYLALAHRTDDVLDKSEIDAITRKLAEWLPAALPSDVVNVVSDVLAAYSDGPPDERIVQSLRSIQNAVPVHQRKAVLLDLQYVAEADNVVLIEEKTVIAELADCWEIDLSTISKRS